MRNFVKITDITGVRRIDVSEFQIPWVIKDYPLKNDLSYRFRINLLNKDTITWDIKFNSKIISENNFEERIKSYYNEILEDLDGNPDFNFEHTFYKQETK